MQSVASARCSCRARLQAAPARGAAARGVLGRPGSSQQRRIAQRAIEEKRDTSGAETTSSPSDLLSSEEARRLSELRRLKADSPAPKPSSNIIQGALEEAQLITWPKPGKALLDTVLVLAIVAGTGAALFGVNVLLTDAFQWWYSH